MGFNKTYDDFDIFELCLIRESNNRLINNSNLSAASVGDHIGIIYDNSEFDYIIKNKINSMTIDELKNSLNKANDLLLNCHHDDSQSYAGYNYLINLLNNRLSQKFIR